MGTPLTNKYAEGYPGRRYYGGCEVVDEVEQLAIDRLKQLFGAEHANVQPHSGAQANFAAFMARHQAGRDASWACRCRTAATCRTARRSTTAASSGSAVHYGVDPATGRIDYDEVREQAQRERPKLIIAGGSAYARIIDFAAFRSIADEVGALFLVDMAHFAGLVAGGVHPSPVPHAQVVTSTTHKTLRGPRAGLILSIAEHAKAIDKSVFPGTQGGPLEHVIAAKAVAFGEALTPRLPRLRPPGGGQRQGAGRGAGRARLRHRLRRHRHAPDAGGPPAQGPHRQGGREDARPGRASRSTRTPFPDDPQSPFVTSGIRLGTPALTTRGMGTAEMVRMAELIDRGADPAGRGHARPGQGGGRGADLGLPAVRRRRKPPAASGAERLSSWSRRTA